MHDPTEVDSGDARRTRSSGLRLGGLLAGAVLAAVLLGQLTHPDSSHRLPAAAVTVTPDLVSLDLAAVPEDQPIGMQLIKQCPVQLGGLALRSHPQVSPWAYERWDCQALEGSWSVVIRADDGHFGFHSAVATFPVNRATTGTPAAKPKGAVWDPARQRLVWPLAGSSAQIVGDIGKTDLVELATRITVEAGKPHLAALDGFNTAAIITYRPALVHEMRYRPTDLGQESKLGDGRVYTGVMSGALLESQALQSRTTPAGFVRAKPAIYADVQGGNGKLAWESAPGEVAYIGYNGSAIQGEVIRTLRALADKGRPLTPLQWQTKDRIPVGRQSG